MIKLWQMRVVFVMLWAPQQKRELLLSWASLDRAASELPFVEPCTSSPGGWEWGGGWITNCFIVCVCVWFQEPESGMFYKIWLRGSLGCPRGEEVRGLGFGLEGWWETFIPEGGRTQGGMAAWTLKDLGANTILTQLWFLSHAWVWHGGHGYVCGAAHL